MRAATSLAILFAGTFPISFTRATAQSLPPPKLRSLKFVYGELSPQFDPDTTYYVLAVPECPSLEYHLIPNMLLASSGSRDTTVDMQVGGMHSVSPHTVQVQLSEDSGLEAFGFAGIMVTIYVYWGTVFDAEVAYRIHMEPIKGDEAMELTKCIYCVSRATNVPCKGEWGPWEQCSATCGAGTWERRYHVVQEHIGPNGAHCPFPEDYKETDACELQACGPEIKDCVGHLTPWSDCTHTCNGGLQYRTYVMENPAENGGQPCPYECAEQFSRKCNKEPCEEAIWEEKELATDCPKHATLINGNMCLCDEGFHSISGSHGTLVLDEKRGWEGACQKCVIEHSIWDNYECVCDEGYSGMLQYDDDANRYFGECQKND
eukprot:GEMP01032656.1.p1 GENE.GEMP01032656.1~~GEMP01032656.1.p1  ORF type:complete len:375 (+),score=77.92 GEMP01032656.1:313-1437(+)